MTTTQKPPVWTGFCNVGRHHTCRGGVNGHPCPCPCHQEPEPVPLPPPSGSTSSSPPTAAPSVRLTSAAAALGTGPGALTPAAATHLAGLLRTEATHAADRGDGYPPDRAPLLELADLINGDPTS